MNKSSQKGFTLLEILLAIAVLSVMMMLIFTLTTDSSNTIDRVMAEDRDFMQVETALSIIDRDISNIYTPLFVETEVKSSTDDEKVESPRINFGGATTKGSLIPIFNTSEKDQIIFMTSGHQRRIENSKQSSYAWVRYSLQAVPSEEKEDKTKGQYRLLRQYYADDPYSNNLDWEKVKAHILLNNLSSLKFSYWDEEKKDYVDSSEEINPKQKVIRLIKVEFSWIDRNGIENPVSKSMRALSVPFDSSKEVKQQKKQTNDNGMIPVPNEATTTPGEEDEE